MFPVYLSRGFLCHSLLPISQYHVSQIWLMYLIPPLSLPMIFPLTELSRFLFHLSVAILSIPQCHIPMSLPLWNSQSHRTHRCPLMLPQCWFLVHLLYMSLYSQVYLFSSFPHDCELHCLIFLHIKEAALFKVVVN